VHLFVRVGRTDAPAPVVRAVTGHTARVLRREFPRLRRFATVLWSRSYVAAAVGDVSESTVRRSIKHQWEVMAS
jgi:putative transposase